MADKKDKKEVVKTDIVTPKVEPKKVIEPIADKVEVKGNVTIEGTGKGHLKEGSFYSIPKVSATHLINIGHAKLKQNK
jgi:hypothetical protein